MSFNYRPDPTQLCDNNDLIMYEDDDLIDADYYQVISNVFGIEESIASTENVALNNKPETSAQWFVGFLKTNDV